MNKTIIWLIILIVIIAGAFFLFRPSTEDTSQEPTEEISPVEESQASQIDEIPESEFSNIETSDDVFSELDLALEALE